eukprot:3519922-Pyramimonas_sp.AAC.1
MIWETTLQSFARAAGTAETNAWAVAGGRRQGAAMPSDTAPRNPTQEKAEGQREDQHLLNSIASHS